MKDIEVGFVESINEIGKDAWNALTGVDNPFTRYEFLWGLERSGCTTAISGWQPYHLTIKQKEGDEKKLIGVMPLYLKSNSYGEYVFDWSWANAYQTHGHNYYPKFVTAVPFTPSVGHRLFLRDASAGVSLTKVIFETIKERAAILNASSWHILFPSQAEHLQFLESGIAARTACQFHWFNRDYQSFDEFLGSLNSRKRKNIKKERQAVMDSGLSFSIIEGADISERQWECFYQFYQSTYSMRGMRGYLNTNFFQSLRDSMPEQLFMIVAQKNGEMIAAALFFKNQENLFGRYWGSSHDFQFLHFETCYYRGQDYCIEHGLKRFDSGAQGEHKIQRGFEPIQTYSNHWIANEGFALAIGKFLKEEERHTAQYMKRAKDLLPFKSA